jgi:hypothetical protein
VTIHHSDGYRSQYLHLSQFLLSDGSWRGFARFLNQDQWD